MMSTKFSLILQLLALIYTGSTSELEASQVMKFQLCHDQPAKNITAPDGYVVFIEQLLIGVTDNDVCEEYDSVNHCIVQAEEVQQAPCTLKENCLYRVPKAEISKCGKNRFATYIYGQYRFIPVTSQNPVIIGQAGNDVDVDSRPFGVIQTENYPKWTEQVDYSRKFTSNNKDKAIRFYLTDMDIEDSDFADSQCKNSFLELSDGANDAHKVCGMLLNQEKYVFTVCTNNEYTSHNLVIRYKTGPVDSFSDYYTGVRGYYEVVDKPDSLNCIPSTIPATTTPETTTTTQETIKTTQETITTTQEISTTTQEISTTTPETTTAIPETTTNTLETTTAIPETTTTTLETTTAIPETTTTTLETTEPKTETTTLVTTKPVTTEAYSSYVTNEETTEIDTTSTIETTKVKSTTSEIGPTQPSLITLTEQVLLNWGYDFNSTHINVSSSNIAQIDKDTFTNFNNLLYLDLSHNLLTGLKLSTFYGLDKLIELRLHHNKLRKFETSILNKLIFQDLISLEYLDLSYNRFYLIHSFYFKGLNNLKKLGLEGNHIVEMTRHSFDPTVSLESVCFKGNPLSFTLSAITVKKIICHLRDNCSVLFDQACCESDECYIP